MIKKPQDTINLVVFFVIIILLDTSKPITKIKFLLFFKINCQELTHGLSIPLVKQSIKNLKMTTKKKILITLSVGVLVAIGITLFMFFKPARDIQATKTDYSYNASDIVNEYLSDADKANDKYLDEEGNSKVLEITGTVANITEDFNNQKVILLKNRSDKAGVSATFIKETNMNTLKIGDKITIKGVIRSGASFDEDLEMYENVILDKCDIISK